MMANTTLFKNGTFFVGEDKYASNVLVKDGNIDKVDIDDEEKGAEVVDLQRKLVLPSFIDAHCHLLLLGKSLTKVDLQGCDSLQDILTRLSDHHKQNHNDGKSIFAKNWIQDMTKPEEIHRSLFDQGEFANVPIYLESFDLHSALLNSAALKEMEVDNSTPTPVGGEFVKDQNGNLTGWVKEMAYFNVILPGIQKRTTRKENVESINKAFSALVDAGYTGVADLLMEEDNFEILTEMVRENGRLPIRVRCYWHCPPEKDVEESIKYIKRAKELQEQWRSNEWLGINGIKFVSDGVVDACTAALLLPYQNGTNAEPLWPLEPLTQAVQEADRLGLQCAIHAIGDRSVRNAIDALESIGKERIAKLRHRIEHLEVTTEEDGERLGKLGIVASVQPYHSDPAFLANWYDQLGGKENQRCCRAFAYKHFLEAGAPIAIGTDAPTAPHFPLPNLYLGATRRSAAKPELEERTTKQFALPLIQSVLAATDGAARACHLDKFQGQIQVGKSADFIIIDLDVLKEDPESQALLKARVTSTYLAGRLVANAS